jgi:hypothetical protein
MPTVSSIPASGQTCAEFVFCASAAQSTSVLAAVSAFALASASWLTTKAADSEMFVVRRDGSTLEGSRLPQDDQALAVVSLPTPTIFLYFLSLA